MSLAVSIFGGIGPANAFPGVDESMRLSAVFFKVVASNNYAAGGDTLDLTALADFIKSSGPPVVVELFSQKAGGTSGFMYAYSPAAVNPAQNNGKMQVFTGAAAQAALTELANGAYPAGVTGDTIIGIAYFPRI
jgi:hypothetical protein